VIVVVVSAVYVMVVVIWLDNLMVFGVLMYWKNVFGVWIYMVFDNAALDRVCCFCVDVVIIDILGYVKVYYIG